ncbi:MAG: hypothetical protein VKO21_06695 [Candidatus Sericytochromatia bacterium]|nr:hypothetical protein [Candidatus Sericytochromatia bacterium]
MIKSSIHVYHPARRGLSMTYSYTRPLATPTRAMATTPLDPAVLSVGWRGKLGRMLHGVAGRLGFTSGGSATR